MNRVNRAHIYIFVVMIISLVAQLIINVILNSTGKGMTFISSALITQYGLVLLPAIIYFIITKTSIKDTLHFKKVSATNVFLVIGLAIFIQPIMSLINLISQLFVKNYMMDYVGDMMAMPFWLLILIMAVTPAITEEITFRGIVLRNYQNQTVVATCLMNGFLFGVFHGNLNQFAYAFFLGAIFCYVAHLTGSIIPSMIMHFVVNGSQVLLQKLLVVAQDFLFANEELMSEVTSTTTTTTTGDLVAGIIVISVFVLGAIPICWLFLRQMHRHNNKGNFIKNKSISGIVMGDLKEQTIVLENGETLSSTDISRERIMSPILILLVSYFVLYSALFEFILPALQG